MYKCAVTGKMSKPGEKVNKVVLEKRDKVYFSWFRNEETGKFEQYEAGRGWEIAAELNVSDEGLKMWNDAKARQAAETVK